MFDHHEDVVERVIRHLSRPIQMNPGLDARVMQQIAALPAHGGSRVAAAWAWLVRPRPIPLPPLAGLAAMVALFTLAALAAQRQSPTPPAAAGEFQFVLVAPHAATVSLVGDFNDWDAARTPMRPLRTDHTVWTVVLPLSPGRYRYAFLVNGAQWLADPGAPAVLDDEFGAPSSVVTVGGS